LAAERNDTILSLYIQQEEGEDKPAPSLPSMRAFVREQSMELAVPISPGPPASIPGLASLLPSVRPRPEPVPPAPRSGDCPEVFLVLGFLVGVYMVLVGSLYVHKKYI
jgi:hypothetical protein